MESEPWPKDRCKKYSYIMGIQTFFSIIGILLSLVLKTSRQLVFVHFFLLCLSFVAIFGYNSQSRTALMIHGYFTLVITISLLIYIAIAQYLLEINYSLIIIGSIFTPDLIISFFTITFLNNLKPIEQEYNILADEPSNDADTHNYLHLCCICQVSEANMVVYRCGHRCLCTTCSERFTKNLSKCPICRKIIEDMVKVYE
ncbi:hypothetical protein SteCoe_4408 [Stentor coeruleus]|uniref:RING-type domain-containing protein n=1 Tax=Stentor coeruleus TaxID=5963 RepID=A0A1R2CUU7_9CILI|nr:hypothetical protein SteCoe_4408 [Stentor coeruleus]